MVHRSVILGSSPTSLASGLTCTVPAEGGGGGAAALDETSALALVAVGFHTPLSPGPATSTEKDHHLDRGPHDGGLTSGAFDICARGGSRTSTPFRAHDRISVGVRATDRAHLKSSRLSDKCALEVVTTVRPRTREFPCTHAPKGKLQVKFAAAHLK